MNDITIIKAISKVHSIIIDLLIFIFITLFTIYFTLHIGLRLDTFILPGLKIEKLYIKWDEKISVNIDSIKITKSNTKSTFDLSTLDANQILKRTHLLDTLFSEVNIKKIAYNDINATFSYKEHQAGYIKVKGPKLDVIATVDMSDHLLFLSIKEFSEHTTHTTISGELLADTMEHRLYGQLKVDVAETLPLEISILADEQRLRLWGRGSHPITKPIGPAVKIANLGPQIEPWIIDQLQGEALTIDYLKATLVYDDPISFLDTLDVKASYTNVHYVFAPGYAPAVAPKVDLAFKDRILYIYPREGTFYGQSGGTTWVKIDFETPANPLLTVDVDTSACMTKELVDWLKGYHIALPFYQVDGKTKVKLALWITLRDIEISANGGFSSKKGTFSFSGTDIKVKDVKVNLNNTDVDIYSLNASLLDNAINVDLSGKFNPVAEKGRFDITVNHLLFGKEPTAFTIDQTDQKLSFSYLLQPQHDRLVIPESHWKYGELPITIQPLVAPFKFSTLSGSVPATLVASAKKQQAYVSGAFNIKALTLDLIVDLVKFDSEYLELDQTSAILDVHYDKVLRLNTQQKSRWKVKGTKVTLLESELSYAQDQLILKKAHLNIDDIVDSYINGKYHLIKGSGKVILQHLTARVDDRDLLEIDKDIKIYIKKKGEEHLMEVPLFNLKYRSNQDGWNMGIKDIHYLSAYSPLLQEFNITSGSIHMRAKKDEEKIDLYGYFDYPYPILVKDNIPLETIKFTGSYHDKTLDLFVNNDIHFQLKYNYLDIIAHKVGINIFALFDFIHDHPPRENLKKEPSHFKVTIEAKDSYIYLNKVRRAPADKLLLQYRDSDLKAQLLYGKNGGAALEYNDKQELFIYGDRLNDKFMNALAEFSDFKGGQLSFYLTGKTDNLDGVIKVENTIVKDYKAINNTLAFINTIPALVTFSVPHYNTKGLKLNEGYAAINYRPGLLKIKGFHLDSPELRFNGAGLVDLDKRSVDVETSLVTEATSNLSKIPLLGYILVGKEEDTITTTMTLTGPMDNPVVKNTLAKDIGVGTFSILKRALTFPVHYVDKAQKAIKEAEKEKKK